MRIFSWVSPNAIPLVFDLRERGWILAPGFVASAGCVSLAHCHNLDSLGWVRFLTVHRMEYRRGILLLGVERSEERTRLLGLGFGEVLGDSVRLAEVEARALRVSDQANRVPQFRMIGDLRLDLVARDAIAGGKPVGLHPREFGLLWRLADVPGAAIDKHTLIRDVWRLNHVPETNSLAVHISRLRSKLGVVGFPRLVQTTVSGSYRLAAPPGATRAAVPLPGGDTRLDRHLRTGGEAAAQPANCGAKRHDA